MEENVRETIRRRETAPDNAFTLIELLLVVVIIGTLAALVVPRYVGWGERAKKMAAGADVTSNIPTGLRLFELNHGRFPTTEEGLKALTEKPASLPNWKGPYLENEPVDPWGKPYQYRSPGTHKPDYDVFSFGPDGKESADDIGNWNWMPTAN